MTTPPTSSMIPGYVCNRWVRYGHDRLYVALENSTRDKLGFRDLKTGIDHPTATDDAGLLKGIADTWVAMAGDMPKDVGPTSVPVGVDRGDVPAGPADVELPWGDLSLNRAGESAQEQATAKRAGAPVKTTLARMLGVKTDEYSWRTGAKGERLVAEQLARLADRDPRSAIHAVPVGHKGADIDHLVIGPGGVFSLNTKHHPDADVWVGGDTFIVNGTRVPYVRNSRFEAQRATRLLSHAVGRPVGVVGLIVPVRCKAPITVKSQPRGVHVVPRRDLGEWFSRLGTIWSEEDLRVIWEVARRSTTWVTTSRRPS